MTAADGLVAFLGARLADDERLARENLAANADARARWLASTLWDEEDARDERTLREVEAKRRILAWCRQMDPMPSMGGILAGEARKILRWLASAYADHPDYRGEWAP